MNTKPDAVEYEMTEEDAANVGRALMETIRANRPGYVWSICPSEIVTDLMNDAHDLKVAVRTAVADYMRSEGCSCCRSGNHAAHRAKLGEALDVPAQDAGMGDGSLWYDFAQYRSEK